jgi:hypothetical protein
MVRAMSTRELTFELAEHVAAVRLNRLLAEEQFADDLDIGLAINDQSGDLKLAFGERGDAGLIEIARAGARWMRRPNCRSSCSAASR